MSLAELEVQYSTTGTKVYANFSGGDGDDEDYVAEDESN